LDGALSGSGNHFPQPGTGYSIFGIGVDRKHEAKWVFPQEKATFDYSRKVYVYSENALFGVGNVRNNDPQLLEQF
jgi:hypothetical protein